MPYKEYAADLQQAILDNAGVEGIYVVGPGENDGEFVFEYNRYRSSNGMPTLISVIILEVYQYPREHNCYVFTTSDTPEVSAALEGLPPSHAKRISRILADIAQHLETSILKASQVADPASYDDDKIFHQSRDEDRGDSGYSSASLGMSGDFNTANVDAKFAATKSRIQSDLKIVKQAGFKIGYHGQLANQKPCFVSIACRIARLGISDNAIEAWHITPSNYVILIVRYTEGFKCLEELLNSHTSFSQTHLRVGTGKHYKPSFDECLKAFGLTIADFGNNKVGLAMENMRDNKIVGDIQPLETKSKGLFSRWRSSTRRKGENSTQPQSTTSSTSDTYGSILGTFPVNENFRMPYTDIKPDTVFSSDPNRISSQSTEFKKLFNSNSLDRLLNERLLKLIERRVSSGFSWYGAEEHYFDSQAPMSPGNVIDDKPIYFFDDQHLSALSNLVTSDQISEIGTVRFSYPLLAMQYFLRHFARCTEFCVVCHRKLPSTMSEAVEPYVCGQPACLTKYMTSDLGTEIEREIHEKPYVVDLLISFCYASAKQYKLKDFPDGLSLKVPHILTKQYVGTFDGSALELTLNINDPDRVTAVQVGAWMAINDGSTAGSLLHCRVTDLSAYPIIQVSPIICSTPMYKPGLGGKPVTVKFYEYDFDSLTVQEKQDSMCLLLDTLPTVKEMKDTLQICHLSSWIDRISPSAFTLLRWIVASNRSCIVQVDSLDHNMAINTTAPLPEDRVYGMGSWMQFRFAMGAPDKEQRFAAAVQAGTSSTSYPTLFAWHGSPLYNWHSIIREGLNFEQTLHGRANGHGCYHSLKFATSQSYTNTVSPVTWSKSMLNVTAAIALNEIVNAPSKFVSRSPHLVVSQLDWICTRYLFVKCAFSEQHIPQASVPTLIKQQDPKMTPVGVQGNIIIPQPKAAKARKDDSIVAKRGVKAKSYVTVMVDNVPEQIPIEDDDTTSICTDVSDLDIFLEDLRWDTWETFPTAKFSETALEQTPSYTSSGNSKVQQTSLNPTDNERQQKAGGSVSQTQMTSRILADHQGPLPPGWEPRKLKEQTFYVDHNTSTTTWLRPAVTKPPTLPLRKPTEPLTDFIPGNLDHSKLPLIQQPKFATPMATKRLQQDFKKLLKIQNTTPLHELGWYIDPEHFDNAYQWIVELHTFDPTLPLAQDMKANGIKSVVLELRFGKDYPTSPPFVRVVKPRFLQFMNGGGGHVTAGGALCMELLTNTGWSAQVTIESVLVQVKLAMSSLDPQPARLNSSVRKSEYSVGEAAQAYIRSCKAHGWAVPKGFEEVAKLRLALDQRYAQTPLEQALALSYKRPARPMKASVARMAWLAEPDEFTAAVPFVLVYLCKRMKIEQFLFNSR